MRFRVLGELEVDDGGRPLTLGRRRERCLLAVLLLEAGHVLPVERLVELLWDREPPAHARRALHVHVARLRAALADAAASGVRLVTAGSGYVLHADPDTVDAHQFRALLTQARSTAEPGPRVELLRAALRLWRGPALADLASERLRQQLCAGLEEERLRALEQRIAGEVELGHHAQVVSELTDLTRKHPHREQLTALLMLALYRGGRQIDALETYRHTRALLTADFGVEPAAVLQRLHEAILRADDPLVRRVLGELTGVSAGAPPAHETPVPAQLPTDIVGFTGREADLRALDRLLDAGPAPGVVVVSAIAGTAGIGKTSLAVHWAHRVRDRFPDGQLYVNLRGFDPSGSPMDPADALRSFLDALGVPAQRIPAGLQAQTGLYRSLLSQRKVLLLLDNARDAEQVRPLLPSAPGCFALVTSRNRMPGLVAAEGAHPLSLDLLSNDEARALLAARLGSDRIAAEPHAATSIVDRCAGLPLALAVAAARAAVHPGFGLAALAGELADTGSGLDAFEAGDPATDLRAVFSWSYRALSAPTARLFRLLGLHPGPDFAAPAAASLAGIAVHRVEPLLAQLVRAYLITEPTAGRYTFHDLLRAYATEQALEVDPAAERYAAIHRLMSHYLHTGHAAALLLNPNRERSGPAVADPGTTVTHLAGYEQAFAWFSAERRALLAAVAHAAQAGLDGHAWQLAWTIANFLDRRGDWAELRDAQRTAVAAARRLADHRGEALASRSLGIAYARLGRYNEAYAHCQHAAELYRQLGDDIGQANADLAVAGLLDRQGQHARALRHAEQALARYRAADHLVGQGNALNAVGWCRAALGDYAAAINCAQQALPLLQGVDSRGAAETWHSLGYAHSHLGRYGAAIHCYQRALGVFRELGERLEEAETLTELGNAYDATGNPHATRDAWQRALDILSELQHPHADGVRRKLWRLSGRDLVA